jgi:hypothetical protein
MSNVREKQILAKRNSSGWTSYEQHKKDQEGSLLNKLAENVGEVIEGVGNVASKSASKVGEVLRRGYHELATPRYVENREQVIDEKVKGKK